MPWAPAGIPTAFNQFENGETVVARQSPTTSVVLATASLGFRAQGTAARHRSTAGQDWSAALCADGIVGINLPPSSLRLTIIKLNLHDVIRV